MSTKLRLGPIPKTDTVRLTITLSARLKADLDRYARLHTEAWGEPIDAARLVPYMLEVFIMRDRGFRKGASGA
jgi:hypothetical protein